MSPTIFAQPASGQSSNTRKPVLSNLVDGEMIYQRFVLVHGRAGPPGKTFDAFISVETSSGGFPMQTFPVTDSHFKALVHLEPGPNTITFTFHPPQALIESDQLEKESTSVNLIYVPLLQLPPLHLAIMVASDSPLLIDCPPEKLGSGGHSDLAACVKKLRMAAYMWQAFTAEEMRARGLGRRSFRIEEEYIQDTVSAWDETPVRRVTAKVHIVRSKHTVAEIQSKERAQQNPHARMGDALYDFFLEALEDYGGPFEVLDPKDFGTTVSGIILDSHYSIKDDLIVGHAALGGNGGPHGKMRLGMFGSHTTWSWPRFVEEIVPCLTDATRVTKWSRVGNDANQCGTFWEACCIGQGAALHEVGHAFGSPHTPTGIMNRGYVEWNRSFISKEAYCDRTKSKGCRDLTGPTKNHWYITDLLRFRYHPMFWQPGDKPFSLDDHTARITIRPMKSAIKIQSNVGIAMVEFTPAKSAATTDDHLHESPLELELSLDELKQRFDPTKQLGLKAIGCNGSERSVENVWDFIELNAISIPGSEIVLNKRSVATTTEGEKWKWAVLLTKLVEPGNDNTKVLRANKVTVQKGLWFDGIYVHYEDGTSVTGGPLRNYEGEPHTLGGGSHPLDLSSEEKITKVEVLVGDGKLDGVMIHTNKGNSGGCLVLSPEDSLPEVEILASQDDEEIIGFYGSNLVDDRYCQGLEFGIITAPRGVTLPRSAYDMKALSNTDGK